MEKLTNRPVPFIERYDPRKDAWDEIHVTSSHELERDNAGVVGSRDQIIISGGFSFNSCSLTASVVELNPSNGIWRELTPLHTAREGHVAIIDDVSIYVIGGKNQSGSLASVERYDKELGMYKFVFELAYKNSTILPAKLAISNYHITFCRDMATACAHEHKSGSRMRSYIPEEPLRFWWLRRRKRAQFC